MPSMHRTLARTHPSIPPMSITLARHLRKHVTKTTHASTNSTVFLKLPDAEVCMSNQYWEVQKIAKKQTISLGCL